MAFLGRFLTSASIFGAPSERNASLSIIHQNLKLSTLAAGDMNHGGRINQKPGRGDLCYDCHVPWVLHRSQSSWLIEGSAGICGLRACWLNELLLVLRDLYVQRSEKLSLRQYRETISLLCSTEQRPRQVFNWHPNELIHQF